MIYPNIVAFGPAHVGKSTLLGYLLVNNGAIPDWNLRVEKLKETIGVNYDKSQKYAYLLDTGVNERKRGSNKGTSQYMHTARIKLGKSNSDSTEEWILIDTPGSQHNERERLKGMFYGDIGVFMVEASKLLKFTLTNKDSLLEDFFAPLIAWDRFERTRKLVVVISKMDEVNFDQKVFEDAKSILQIVLMGSCKSVPIVPISINVNDETECNITRGCSNISWYKGKPLVDTIKHLMSTCVDEDNLSINSFMTIDKLFDKKGHKLILRGKVLKGRFFVDQKVKISPVKLETGEFISAEAKILQINEEKDLSVDVAREGRIVSLSLSSIKEKNIKLIRSSTILPVEAQGYIGGIIEVKLNVAKFDSEFSIGESVKILWFGRLLSGNILCIIKDDFNGISRVFIELVNSTVALSFDENSNFYFHKFYLKKDHGSQKIISDFATVHLINIFSGASFIYKKDELLDKYDELSFSAVVNRYSTQVIDHDGLIIIEPSYDISHYDMMNVINSYLCKSSGLSLPIWPHRFDWLPAKQM